MIIYINVSMSNNSGIQRVAKGSTPLFFSFLRFLLVFPIVKFPVFLNCIVCTDLFIKIIINTIIYVLIMHMHTYTL